MADTPAIGLKQRLETLARRFSQAEIARKTGISRNNVSRYMRGTRMPLEFGSALVSGLGVNPAWLLSGTGAAFLADVTADTGQMAGNLLELVQAMGAVARMRLGSLTGKEHAKMLRELNDALVRHEGLRGKLNARSREIFSQLLSDVRAALARMDLRRASELVKAAEQVSRLSDDESLKLELKGLQAHVLFLQRRDDEALALQRQVFMGTLLRASSFDEEGCNQVLRFALMVNERGDTDEGLRVVRAGLALADSRLRKTQAFAELAFIEGNLLAQRGELPKGLAIMQRHLARASGRRQLVGRTFVLRAQLLMGLVEVPQACALMPAIEPGAELLLRAACLAHSVPALEAALNFVGAMKQNQDIAASAMHGHAQRLLGILRGGAERAEALTHLRRNKPAPGGRALSNFFGYAVFGHLAFALGERAAAAELLAQAHQCVLKFPQIAHADFALAAIVYGALARVPGDLRGHAKKFLERAVSRGCEALRPLLPE